MIEEARLLLLEITSGSSLADDFDKCAAVRACFTQNCLMPLGGIIFYNFTHETITVGPLDIEWGNYGAAPLTPSRSSIFSTCTFDVQLLLSTDEVSNTNQLLFTYL